jgi:membrane associated rhomboid family serine protease
MLIPYNTDAPIYHWPYATLGTIILNALVFLGISSLGHEDQDWFYSHLILVYGEWNPVQWLTSNYMHGGFMHVLGNMVVLWGIGIIIEGKVGWLGFLTIYNGIGVFQSGLEQTLMLGASTGASLGASSIVYGLIAMAMVWAPKNELNCILAFGRITTMDVSVLAYATFSIGVEVVLGVLQALFMAKEDGLFIAMTSQILHLMGAATGFALATLMVKRRWVDCENWDLFSVLQDRHTMSREELNKEALASEEGQTKLAAHRNQLVAQFHSQLAAGDAEGALAVHRRGKHQLRDNWQISDDDHIQIISGLRKAQKWEPAVVEMVEYLKTPAPRSAVVRLALAQVLVEQLGRPGQALKVLAKLDAQSLSASQKAVLERVQARAKKDAEDDPFEVMVEDW